MLLRLLILIIVISPYASTKFDFLIVLVLTFTIVACAV